MTGKLICDWSWGVCDCLTGHGDRDWSRGLDWSLSPTYTTVEHGQFVASL